MRSLNKVTLIGHVGADPEIRTVTSGARVAQFSVATSRQWTGKDGQQQEKTEWHRVVVWDSMKATFAFVERFVAKGDRLFVEGSIEYRSYEAKDGSGTKYTTEIRAQEVIDVSRGRPEDGASGGRGASSRTGARAMAGAAAGSGGPGEYDDFQAPGLEEEDDMPF